MTTVLAISPHLDDAVFSAGGTLAQRAAQGCRVVIATVFTGSVRDPQGFALACQLDKGLPSDLDYMALRREEDAAACAIIGAEPIWLPFVEAPHRGYHSATQLFEPMRADDGIVATITPRLIDLLDDLEPDELFAPMAVGAHVDHVAVVEAIIGLNRPCRFWVDFPYLIRLGHKPSPFADLINRLQKDPVTIESWARGLKLDASLAYASQIAFQFGSDGEARDSLNENSVIELFGC